MDPTEQSPGQNAPAGGRQFALRFISGKYQGGEFPLTEGVPVIVGRSSDLDMVLVEEMVSRRHARIEMRAGIVNVEDLGSTNGTFVNGERINQGTLAEGDRLLIGTSILKLVTVEDQSQSRANLQQVALGQETVRKSSNTSGSVSAVRMTGNLDEIPLPDLMQLFGTSKKTGTLVLHTGKIGRIHLRGGVLVNAGIDGQKLTPLKAAIRMLSWTEGTFALEPEDEAASSELDLTAQAFLMEGIRQQDELANLLTTAPGLSQRLTLKTPLKAPLQDLEQHQLEVLQAAINAPDFQAAIDRSPKTDLDTVKDVIDLMKRGYLDAK